MTMAALVSDVFSVFPQDVIQEVKLALNFSELIEAFVKRQAIEQAAKRLKIQIKPDELQLAADRFRLKNGLVSACATFEWLEQNALSIEEFELLLYSKVLEAKLSRHLFQQQVEAHFTANKYQYSQAEISEIVLPEVDLAFDLFEAIKAEPICFDQALSRYWGDPSVEEVHVYRGRVSRSTLHSTIATAVFAATPPQVLTPIVLNHQVHLILVRQLIEPQLDDTLQKQIRSELLTQWLKQQIAQADIHLKL